MTVRDCAAGLLTGHRAEHRGRQAALVTIVGIGGLSTDRGCLRPHRLPALLPPFIKIRMPVCKRFGRIWAGCTPDHHHKPRAVADYRCTVVDANADRLWLPASIVNSTTCEAVE